jgi:Zn-dependent peptidase ImmA (M78 family)
MANKSNTIAKGNAFEDRVFTKFKELLETGELSFDSKYCHVYQKKSYKGKSGSNIVFDISIEVFMPNATKYCLLLTIECKDYNSAIQVDKLRDFSSRIEDVAAHKGIFVASSRFQQGAFDWAKSKGIGLAILDNSNNESWVLQRIGKQKYQIKQEIEDYFTNGLNENSFPFVAISGYSYFTSIVDFLSEAVEYNLPLPFNVKYLSFEKIEEIICSTFPEKSRTDIDYYLRTEELVSFVEKQGFTFNFNTELLEQLGYCDFQNKTISITNSINLEYNSPRWRFTFAHEIGHLVLHHYLFSNHNVNSIDDDEKTIYISEGLTKRLEIQANKFATKLLVPDKILFYHYTKMHNNLGLRNRYNLYVDWQRENLANYHKITAKLGEIFGVSKEVIKNNLLELQILTIDASSGIQR